MLLNERSKLLVIHYYMGKHGKHCSEQTKPDQKETINCIISVMWHARKCNLIYSDRNISGFLWRLEHWSTRAWESVLNWCTNLCLVLYLDGYCGGGYDECLGICICQNSLIHTLKTLCILFYVNYSLIKQEYLEGKQNNLDHEYTTLASSADGPVSQCTGLHSCGVLYWLL